jgi:protein TonB
MSIALESLNGSAHRELRNAYVPALRGALLAAVSLHLLAWWLSPAPVPRAIPYPARPLHGFDYAPDYRVLPAPRAVERPQIDTMGEIVPVENPISLDPVMERERPFLEPLPVGPGRAEGPADFSRSESRAPEVLRMVSPEYPRLARDAECEGFVVVRVTIDVEGRVRAATVVRSDVVRSLEEAALAAVRQWIFSPARQGGRPVAVQLEVPFVFTLD